MHIVAELKALTEAKKPRTGHWTTAVLQLP